MNLTTLQRRQTHYAREFEFYESLGRIPRAFVVFDKEMLRAFQRLSR